ncbi:MAG: hypothetical protein PWQ70_1626 [Clostridiales bacterium]|nr:hypothetical protein [Clostridiales bacterium]
MSSYIDIGGLVVPIANLQSNKAKELALLLQSGLFDYAVLVECRIDNNNNADIVIFDIEVELAQKKVADIRPIERIACVFSHADDCIPIVYALRDDFPIVPHLNLMQNEFPRSLCLFEENYDDMKIGWSNNEMIIRIANWLSKTSMGKLHSPDQPLELLLANSTYTLILPENYFEAYSGPRLYQFTEKSSPSGRKTFIAQPFNPKTVGKCYIDILLRCNPIVHGIIRKLPTNLFELSQILKEADIDLIKTLKKRCQELLGIGLTKEQYNSYEFVLIICLPKLRATGADPEEFEVRAFILNSSILNLGTSLGVWGNIDGLPPGIIFGSEERDRIGEDIAVYSLNVHETFSRRLAAHISGYEIMDCNIVMIGAGALGSHLLCNSLRTGFGQWTVVDDDDFFPHNIGRHVLNKEYIGYNKAISIAEFANTILQSDKKVVEGIPANILRPGTHENKVNDVLEKADVILDASTSVAVERYLAFYPSSDARRVSAFFNPRGTDLVMLIEDKKRQTTLDFLEIQYYRNLIYMPELEEHMKVEPDKIRYSASCRDISNRIPQENIVMLSSICSSFLRKALNKEEGAIHIWHLDQDSFDVKHFRFDIFSNKVINTELGWTIVVDEYLEKKLKEIRIGKLPVETGGVLIGSYDMSRKIVYIVDTIPSPPDSDEHPKSYIRGCNGLEYKVNKIKELTQGKLDYIGEWHSHPEGCSGNPSDYDIALLTWVTNYMVLDGHPGLMTICSDDGLNFYMSGVIEGDKSNE